jgi:hypothetical protein
LGTRIAECMAVSPSFQLIRLILATSGGKRSRRPTNPDDSDDIQRDPVSDTEVALQPNQRNQKRIRELEGMSFSRRHLHTMTKGSPTSLPLRASCESRDRTKGSAASHLAAGQQRGRRTASRGQSVPFERAIVSRGRPLPCTRFEEDSRLEGWDSDLGSINMFIRHGLQVSLSSIAQ